MCAAQYESGPGPFILQTDKGLVLKADVVYRCTGGEPLIAALTSGLSQSQQLPAAGTVATGSASSIDKGIVVAETLQVIRVISGAGSTVTMLLCDTICMLPVKLYVFCAFTATCYAC